MSDESQGLLPSGKQFLDTTTPAPIFKTKYGSLQMTTHDLAEQYGRPLLSQLEASDLMGRHCNDLPLRLTLKYPSNQVNILSARNMDPTVATASTTGGLNIETPAGRKSFTVDEYIKLCVEEQPRVVLGMADETNHSTSKKRSRKAYDATLHWFAKISSSKDIDWEKCFLFGVVTGIGSRDDVYVRAMVDDLLQKGAKGMVISGYGQGESEADKRLMVAAVRGCVAANRPAEEAASFPIMVQGVNDIEQIVEAISLGIDLIATDLPAVLTSMGYAFSRYDMTPLDTKTDGTGEPPAKKAKKEEATSTADSFYINIRDRKYARDLKPLMVGCDCHSCRSHSRGYIHHLILAHELLGEVLINAHNQHNLLRLFDVAKGHVKEGTIGEWAGKFKNKQFV